MQVQHHTSLSLLADVSKVRCLCFHPTLRTVYVAISTYVVEYDLNTGAQLSTFYLQSKNIISLHFLTSRNAWVAVMEDGNVTVVSGGMVVSQLHFAKSAKDGPSISCTALQDSTSLPLLFFVRRGAKIVSAAALLSQSKSMWRFEGHKKPVTMIASHPSYPLMAAAAQDGTVRIYRTDNMSLYNILEGQKSKGKGTAVVYVALQFDKANTKAQKTASAAVGQRKIAAKGKLHKQLQATFKKVQLLVAVEKGSLMLFDVSIPGSPKILRTLFSPGAIYRTAHFHTTTPGRIFTLDSKGLYYPYSSGDTALSKMAKQNAELNLLQPAANIEPFKLDVVQKVMKSSAKSELTLPDEDGVVQSPANQITTMRAHMHPMYNYVVFTGEDLKSMKGAANNQLSIFAWQHSASEQGDALPVVSPLVLPGDCYFPPGKGAAPPGPSVASGNIFFLECNPLLGIALKTFALSTNTVSMLTSCKTPVMLGTRGEKGEVMNYNPVRLVTSSTTPIRREIGPRFLLFIRAAFLRTSNCFVKVSARSRGLHASPPGNANCQYRHLFTLISHAGIPSSAASSPPSAIADDPWCFIPGLDGCFVGPDEGRFLILAEHGFHATLYTTAKESGVHTPLHGKMARIFPTPLGQKCVVMYYRPDANQLVFSSNFSTKSLTDVDRLLSSESLEPSGPSFNLTQGETPLQVQFQQDVLRRTVLTTPYLLALMTTWQLLLMNSDLVVLTSISVGSSPLKSIYWVGRSLVYNTGMALQYITTDGMVEACTSVPPDTVIVGALRDRLIGASKEDGKTSLWFKHLRMYDLLVHGVCTEKNGDGMLDESARTALLQHVTSRFDCSKVNASVLTRLRAMGFRQLSNLLMQQINGQSKAGDALPWRDRIQCLLDAKDVESAVGALQAVYSQGTGVKEGEPLREQSPLWAPYMDLLCTCVRVGNQDVAVQALKKMNNPYSVIKELHKRADGSALRFVGDQCKSSNPQLVPMVSVFLRSFGDLGPTDTDLDEPEWTLCKKVSDMPCMALVIPQEADEDWREQEMWVEPMKLTDVVGLLGVPPLDVSAATQDEGGDQEEDYNDADFEADFDEHDAPSSEGTDEFSTDGADDEDGDDDMKPHHDGNQGSKSSEGKDSDDEDDEDAVSKEQEELRRQYLNSMAGHGDDDDDSDDDTYRKPKMKIKFKISDTAIVKPQAPIGTISLGMVLPTASTSKRKPGRAGGGGGGLAPPPGVSKAALGPEPTPEPTKANLSPADLFREGLACMDKGKFSEALTHVTASCDMLIQDSVQIAKKTQIVMVVQYKAALSILIKTKELEGVANGGLPPPTLSEEVVQQLAFLTLLLMQLSLLPRHQLICQKLASRKNFEAKNYAGASRVLKILIPSAPEKFRDSLEQQLQTCEENDNKSTLPEPACREKVNFCWEGFKLLKVQGEDPVSAEEEELQTASVCTYCPAMFDAGSRPPHGTCGLCKYGQLE
uniref:Uncharacterized protein n=1 Tax=Eutreptiella gymnastica TaxID=73025 RepID=A0A7S1IRZ7_9EUGL|mmetsp:Transcript_39056/g.69983  ORF Transcript_39056/g.69983 Transcript_39056/m.69983 type:complete len:1464 (+) Transcript_39056:46-4437(+)